MTKEEAERATDDLRDQINIGVRMVMAEVGWSSIRAAARACHIGTNAMNHYFRKKNTWTIDSLSKVATASRIPVWEILKRGQEAWSSQRERERQEALRERRDVEAIRKVLSELGPETLAGLAEEIRGKS